MTEECSTLQVILDSAGSREPAITAALTALLLAPYYGNLTAAVRRQSVTTAGATAAEHSHEYVVLTVCAPAP